MIIKQGNGVEVVIQRVEDDEIVFDLALLSDPNRRVASSNPGRFYQNLTIKEAKALRKALKAAIKGDSA